MTSTIDRSKVRNGVGESPLRPEGTAKVADRFAFASDVSADLQCVGLTVMEELVVDEGRILNANFTDYLLSTFGDAPNVDSRLIEEPSHLGPAGCRGCPRTADDLVDSGRREGIADAIGDPLTRAPVRPQDIVPGYHI